jgi:hypothetical protein
MARRSGMNRKRFLQTAGLGAAGVGAAAMGMSGMASAAATTGAWNIAVVYSSTKYKEAADEAKDFLVDSGFDNTVSTSTSDIYSLLQTGFNVILGVDTSSNAHVVAGAIKAAGNPVIYIEAFGTADDLNPNYAGSLYTTPPNYYLHTAVRSSTWGYLSARELNNAFTFPEGAKLAFIRREVDSFGEQAKDGFEDYFEKTVDKDITIADDGSDAVAKTAVLNDVDGSTWIVGSALSTSSSGPNAVPVVEALADNGNADNIYLATTGTINSGFYDSEGCKLDETACGWLESNVVGLVAHYNEERCGYWAHEVWRKHNGYTSSYGHRHARAFDAAWLLANSLKFTNQFEQACAIMTKFSNAPGAIIHPFPENLSMKRADTMIADYDGASGPINLVGGELGLGASFFQIWVHPTSDEIGTIISG